MSVKIFNNRFFDTLKLLFEAELCLIFNIQWEADSLQKGNLIFGVIDDKIDWVIRTETAFHLEFIKNLGYGPERRRLTSRIPGRATQSFWGGTPWGLHPLRR